MMQNGLGLDQLGLKKQVQGYPAKPAPARDVRQPGPSKGFWETSWQDVLLDVMTANQADTDSFVGDDERSQELFKQWVPKKFSEIQE